MTTKTRSVGGAKTKQQKAVTGRLAAEVTSGRVTGLAVGFDARPPAEKAGAYGADKTLGKKEVVSFDVKPSGKGGTRSYRFGNTKPVKVEQKKRGFTGFDLEEVSDNPAWTNKEIATARPFAEVLPGLAANLKRSRGRPRVEFPKVAVSIRLDAEVLERLRSEGKGWQSEVNEILRKATGLPATAKVGK